MPTAVPTRYFLKIGQGLYRATDTPVADGSDAQTWTEQYDLLLERHDRLAIVFDPANRPALEAGPVLARWYRSRRTVLAQKLACAIYIVPDPDERADLTQRHARIARQIPFPKYFIGSLALARRLASETLATG